MTNPGAGPDGNFGFSAGDFAKLKRAPFLLFFLMAAADGRIDKTEFIQFVKVLAKPEAIQNPLLNHIMASVAQDAPAMLADIADQKLDYAAELAQLKSVIEANLPAGDANEFKKALFFVSKQIAEASQRFVGVSGTISKNEQTALAAITASLGIQP